jgi:uncharacterized protein
MNILDFLTNGQASQINSNGDGAQRLVANLMMQRSEWMKSLLDSSRNIDGDCGYPTGYIDPKIYNDLYQREPIASRVCEVYPKESWQVQPQIYELEDASTKTQFEEAWDALGKQLRGEQSFYQEEEASVVFDFLCDADIKCGIGHYAAILLGFDDGAPLDQPIDLIDAGKSAKASSSSSSGTSHRLLFMQVYPETAVRINSLEADMQSPRYGLPTEYDISMMDPLEFSSLGVGTSLPSNRANVHWTRVVHISEYGVLHTPRQRPVLNRLLDLRKLYGGSAEMYWRGAFPGYAIKTQPQLGADVDINREDVKQQLTDYSNALQRFLVLMGMDITALAPQVSDPASQIDTQITAICIQLGIPKRIFMGSERGELASSQDDQAWNDRLKQRQLGVITPRIIIPFVDRLIATRVLPRPAKGYRVSWPDLTSKSDEEKAGIATQRTQAIAAYTAGQLETTLAPMDFWTRIMGFTEDESQSIIANAEEIKQQKEKEQAAKDAEAARVQAEAQAKMDAAAKTAADATGTEQTPTAPGSPTGPGKPFGGKGSQSPTSTPPNGSTGQPGGSNTVGNSGVGNTFCPTGPGGGVDPSCSPKSATGSGGGAAKDGKGSKATPQEEIKKLLRTARRLQGEAATKAEWGHRWYREVLPLLDSARHQEVIGAVKGLLVKIRTEQYPGMAEESRRVASLGHTLGVSHDAYFNLSAAAGALKEATTKAAKAERHLITAYRRKARLRRDARSGGVDTQNQDSAGQGDGSSPTQPPQSGASVKPGGSNVGGAGTTPVAHAFDTSQPLDNLDTNAKAALSGGRWVTIEGRHVYLKGGKIVAGPPDLKGETLASAQVKVSGQTKEGTGKGASEPKAKPDKATTTKPEASKARTTAEPTTAPDKEHATPNRGLPDQARPTLHEHEARAIKGYTIYAKELNASLRSGDKLSEMDSKIHEGLTSAFGRAKDFKEPVNVYRGMRLPASDQGAFLKRITEAHARGEEITIPGYMSTSTSQKEAKAFATAYNFPTRVVLEVKAKRGLDLQSFSYVPEQKEFLLDHNSKFTVGSVKKRGELTYVTLEHK